MLFACMSERSRETFRGVAMGVGYIGICNQNQSTLQIINCRTLAFVSCLLAVLFKCGKLTCFDFEIGMTS